MLVYIDEAGDTGYKFDGGSTKYYILGMFIVENDIEADKLCRFVDDFKATINANIKEPAKQIKELKSSKLAGVWKLEFYEKIANNPNLKYSISYVALDKREFFKKHPKLKKDQQKNVKLINHCIAKCFWQNKFEDANIYFDKNEYIVEIVKNMATITKRNSK